MDEICSSLSIKGNAILTNSDAVYGIPYELELDKVHFFELCSFVSSNLEKQDLLLGFLQSFALYMFDHVNEFDANDINMFWDFIIALVQSVSSIPCINFICDAIFNVVTRTGSISDQLLGFIATDTDNAVVKPFLLHPIIDDLPPGYLSENSEYILHILPEAFPLANVHMRNFFLRIVFQSFCDDEAILQNEELVSCIWQQIFSVVFSDEFNEEEYQEMVDCLIRIRRINKTLFSASDNPFIHQQISRINEFTKTQEKFDFVLKLIRLVPFMDDESAISVFGTLIDILTSFIDMFKVPPSNIKHFFDDISDENLVSEEVVRRIVFMCSDNANKNQNVGASLYVMSFFELRRKELEDLLHKMLEIQGEASHNITLAIIANIAPQISEYEEFCGFFSTKFYPVISTIQEGSLFLEIKALKEIIKNDVLSACSVIEILNNLLVAIKGTHIKKYCKLLSEIIIRTNGESETAPIKELIRSIVSKEDCNPELRARALIATDDFFNEDNDFIMELASNSCMFIQRLIEANMCELAVYCIEFIFDEMELNPNMEEWYEKLLPFYNYLLDVAIGNRGTTELISLTAASIANRFVDRVKTLQDDYYDYEEEECGGEEENKELIFPIDVIKKLVSSEDNEVVAGGIGILSHNVEDYEISEVLEIFGQIVQRSFVDTNCHLTNQMLSLCKSIVYSQDVIPEIIINYELAVSLGRFKFFNGMQFTNSIGSITKYFDVMAAFIKKGCNQYMDFLIHMFNRLPVKAIKRAVRPFIVYASKREGEDFSDLECLWNVMLSVLKERVKTPASFYIVKGMMSVYDHCRVKLELVEFTRCLFTMLDVEGHNNNTVELVSALLTAFSESDEMLPINNELFEEALQSVGTFKYKFRYSKIFLQLIKIFDMHIEEYHLEKPICRVFAQLFLSQVESRAAEVHKIECFDETKRCLAELASVDPESAKSIWHDMYSRDVSAGKPLLMFFEGNDVTSSE